MSKNLVIRSAISLAFICFIYTLFWFFKVGQLEKRIAKFVRNNSAYITVGEIKSYGFPLSQKIALKNITFSIPNPILDQRRYSISEALAVSDIFANNFNVTFAQGISSQDNSGDISRLKFKEDPQLNIVINNKNNVSITYKDNGFNMMDPSKDLVFRTSALSLKININSADINNVKVNIDSNIKDMVGFDIVDLYNNSLQENIQKSIQTGKLFLGSSTTNNADSQTQPNNEVPIANSNENIDQQPEANSQDIPTPQVNENTPTAQEQVPVPSPIPEATPQNSDQQVAEPEISTQNLNLEIAQDSNAQLPVPSPAANNVNEEQNDNLQVIVEESAAKTNVNPENNIAKTANAVDETKINEQTTQNEVVSNPQDINQESVAADTGVDTQLPDNLAENTAASPEVNNQDDQQQQAENAKVQNDSQVTQENLPNKNRYNQDAKGNLKLSITYILTPNNSDQNDSVPFDPTKIQVLPTQYNKEIKVNNIEYSSTNYRISASGSLKLVADDTMPSGNLLLKIEKHDSFFGYFKDYIKFDLTQKGYDLETPKLTATEVVSEEISDNNNLVQNEEQDQNPKQEESAAPTQENNQIATSNDATNIENPEISTDPNSNVLVEEEVKEELVIKDPYDNFLKKIHDNLTQVSAEIAMQNPASTNEEHRFEISRQKNLEFKVNNTPLREILGKFNDN